MNTRLTPEDERQYREAYGDEVAEAYGLTATVDDDDTEPPHLGAIADLLEMPLADLEAYIERADEPVVPALVEKIRQREGGGEALNTLTRRHWMADEVMADLPEAAPDGWRSMILKEKAAVIEGRSRTRIALLAAATAALEREAYGAVLEPPGWASMSTPERMLALEERADRLRADGLEDPRECTDPLAALEEEARERDDDVAADGGAR